MSDNFLSNVNFDDSTGVKWAKLQRWVKLSCVNAGIPIGGSDPLLSDIDPSESESVKFAKLQRWLALLATNISGGGLRARDVAIFNNSVGGITSVEIKPNSPFDVPIAPGSYLLLGYISVSGESGLTIPAFSVLLRLIDDAGNTVKSFAYNIPAQINFSGVIQYITIIPGPTDLPGIEYGVGPATNWAIRTNGINPSNGEIGVSIQVSGIHLQ